MGGCRTCTYDYGELIEKIHSTTILEEFLDSLTQRTSINKSVIFKS